jgi:DNA-binding NtrC family response regulator
MEHPKKHGASRELEGTRLVIVEDDAILLMDLESILRDAGAEILGSCRTIDEGLAAAEIDGVSAAVLDVRVGQESIEPVARRLYQRRVPFVFYTGQIDGDPAIAEWPDCRIIIKPARARTIVSAVANALSKKL